MGNRSDKCMAYLYSILLSLVAELSATCLSGNFEQQIEIVLQEIRPTPEQLRDTTRVSEDVQSSFQKRWPGSTIVQFGATMTGLALRGSDVDCFLVIPNRSQINIDDIALLSEAQDELQLYPTLYSNFKLDPSIYVPLLSFVHEPTGMSVDLTINRPITLGASALIAYFLKIDARIMRLATIIKYWSQTHGVGGFKSSLSNYAVTILVLFYLQQKNILPSIASLQERVKPDISEHWNIAFEPNSYNISNNESLYELLGGFFEYYSVFNFDDIVSPYCGCIIKREQLEHLKDLPKVLSAYESNLRQGLAMPFNFGSINIIDIFKLDFNDGKPWNNSTMAEKLKFHLTSAAEAYKNVKSDKFLQTILKSDKHDDSDYLNLFEGC